MVHQLHSSLRERRESSALLDEEVLGSATGDGAAAVKLVTVHLQHADRDVVLFVGQTICTPMGKGVVATLDPAALKISVQLGFGLLHAHLARAACWCDSGRALDAHSEGAVLQYYEDVVRDAAPSQLRDRMASLSPAAFAALSSGTVEEAEEAADETDEDEGSGPDEPSSGTDDDMAVAGDDELSSERLSDRGSSSASAAGRLHRPVAEAVFPLPRTETPSSVATSRAAVKSRLVDLRAQSQASSELSRPLALVFAPPATMPLLVPALKRADDSRHIPSANPLVKFDLGALQDSNSPSEHSASALLWGGDVGALRR